MIPDHILPADPRDRVRDAYRTLATEDRPGNPYDIPFDPRPSRIAFWIRTTLQGLAVILFVYSFWRLLP